MDARVMTVDVTPNVAMMALWSLWVISWWIAAIWSDRSVKRPGTGRQLLYRAFVGLGVFLTEVLAYGP